MEPESITVAELKRLLDKGTRIVLIDVREPYEYEICNIKGSKLVPLDDLSHHLSEFEVDVDYVVYCHTGQRSEWANALLRRKGINAKNLRGGIDAWAIEVDHEIARY